MRKPIWVRAIGWAGWLMVAVFGVTFYAWYGSANDSALAAGGTVALVIALALFVVWGLISFILKVIGWNARAQADKASLTLQGLGRVANLAPAPAAPAPRADVWDNPPTRVKCDGCGRYHAIMICGAHRQYLCFPCMARHDQHDCSYVAAGRYLDEEHKQPAEPRQTGKVLGM